MGAVAVKSWKQPNAQEMGKPAMVYADGGTVLSNKKEGTTGPHISVSESQSHEVEQKIQTYDRTFCEIPLMSRSRAGRTNAWGRKSGKGLMERAPGGASGGWAWFTSRPGWGSRRQHLCECQCALHRV